MPDFELRHLTEADRTYLARLNFLTDTFGDEHKELTPQFEADFDYYLRGWNPSRGGFIAWSGAIPAGGVWLNWGTKDRHGYGHVAEGIPEFALAVEPRFRGQGVGTLLLDAATNLAREKGAPGVSLSVAIANERAHRLYLHLGFEPVDEAEGHIVLVKRFKPTQS
ncbi:acetyltransferase family protein [Corynebacterium simulans]|uniref:GNAT family N-acetyltransferase n=1 Tax=Corynebacterium TaxID=1716 RepID=UPI0007803077|nr:MULTISPECIES: N-acetyltransferase [Corynebacterium]AMO89147.1 acetyltransferase family protein [Corynebacterium simulans]OFT47889.1 acetyltransferase [Corynebacterium sp. HMSC06G04]